MQTLCSLYYHFIIMNGTQMLFLTYTSTAPDALPNLFPTSSAQCTFRSQLHSISNNSIPTVSQHVVFHMMNGDVPTIDGTANDAQSWLHHIVNSTLRSSDLSGYKATSVVSKVQTKDGNNTLTHQWQVKVKRDNRSGRDCAERIVRVTASEPAEVVWIDNQGEEEVWEDLLAGWEDSGPEDEEQSAIGGWISQGKFTVKLDVLSEGAKFEDGKSGHPPDHRDTMFTDRATFNELLKDAKSAAH